MHVKGMKEQSGGKKVDHAVLRDLFVRERTKFVFDSFIYLS